MTIELATDQTEEKETAELNPFSDGIPKGQYFTDAYRTLSLNKLLHLAPYSELLLVTGASGSGRTCLVSEFVNKAADTWRTALVPCRESDSESDLLLKIIEQIEMPLITAEESRGVLLDSLARFLESLGRSARRAIIVLDDADNLSDGHLSMLAVLLADYRSEDSLSIVFVASEGFPERMRQHEQLHRRLVYNLELQGMELEQLRDYIGHRLVVAGMVTKSALFTTKVLTEILAQSSGMPGRVNLLAKDVLDNKVLLTRPNTPKSGNKWRWILITFGGLIAAALLYFQNEINQFIAQQDSSSQEDARPQTEEMSVVDPVLVPLLLPPINVPSPELSSDELDTQSVVLAPVTKPLDSVVDDMPGPPIIEIEQAVLTVPADIEPEMTEPEPIVKEAIPEPVKLIAPTWLLAQPAGNYTMQLMALKDEQKVRDFVIKNKIEDQSDVFYIYRRSGRLAALVYGSYENKDKARIASQGLPKSWRVKSPWLRSFEDVQKEYNAGEQ